MVSNNMNDSMTSPVDASRIASCFKNPSLALHRLADKAHHKAAPPMKRQKTTPDADSVSALLHCACRRSSTTVQEIDAILAKDPYAASRPVSLSRSKIVCNPVTITLNTVEVKETFQFPLNLAIQYKLSAPVLERLVRAAPSILAFTEGPDNMCPLQILLRYQPTNEVSVDMMLMRYPLIAGFCDTKLNTPLHTAVSRGASLRTIQRLAGLWSQALTRRNFHSHTPLELAQRHGNVSNYVVDFLLSQQQELF
jgi:hypothetical protein